MATIYENAQQKNGKINEEKCAELKSEKRANKINWKRIIVVAVR